jgi:hypothetical protein
MVVIRIIQVVFIYPRKNNCLIKDTFLRILNKRLCMFILIKIKKLLNRLFCIAGLHEFRITSKWEFCTTGFGINTHKTTKMVVSECRFCNKSVQENYVDGKRV